MKARRFQTSGPAPGPNLAPLVDVVVVLLVFLMFAVGRDKPERAVSAAASFGTSAPLRVEPGPRVDIYVDRFPPAASDRTDETNGGDGLAARVAGGGEAHDADELAAELASRRQRLAAAGTVPGAVQVLIHPGRGVRWGQMAQAHAAAKQAGFQRVSFVQVPGPGDADAAVSPGR